MGILDRLFGHRNAPHDDYHLAGSLAAAIDGLLRDDGFDTFERGPWFVILGRNGAIGLMRSVPEEDKRESRAVVRIQTDRGFGMLKAASMILDSNEFLDDDIGKEAREAIAAIQAEPDVVGDRNEAIRSIKEMEIGRRQAVGQQALQFAVDQIALGVLIEIKKQS